MAQKESVAKRKVLFAFLSLFLLAALRFVLGIILQPLNLEKYEVEVELPVTMTTIYFVNCIVSPIYEELTYRLILKFNIVYVVLSLLLFLFEFIFLYEKNRFFLEIGAGFSSRMFLFLLGAFIIIFLAFQKSFVEKLSVVWREKFMIVLIVSQFLFGLAHLNRFDLSLPGLYPFLPVIIVAFFLIGVYFSFVRMKLGIVSSIICHCIYNSLTPLILFLTSN